MSIKLTFLFDGACPLCLKETSFLKSKDKSNHIRFVDIDKEDYSPKEFKGISYETAMLKLHGILDNGEIIKGIDVLAYAYDLIGLGWIYYPTKIPLISDLLNSIYSQWAKYRLHITGRDSLNKLCTTKCKKK